jgi:hypothetical protein
MRPIATFLAAMPLVLTACASHIDVQTDVDPQARLERLHTFSILPVPERARGGRPVGDHPMLVNSFSYRAMREALREQFTALGYSEVEQGADFTVAYYASTREKLDVTRWNYGYAWRPRYSRGWGMAGYPIATEYVEGTVVIDAVDPQTKEPLWRGSGVTRVSDDPAEYRKDLTRAVAAVLAKFPGTHPRGAAR